MKPLRIAMTVPGLSRQWTGLAEAVRSQAAALAAAGHEVTVYTSDLTPNRIPEAPSGPIDGVMVKFFPTTSSVERHFYSCRPLLKAFEAGVDTHDVVEIHGLWTAVTAQAAALCRRRRRPYVITPHGQMTQWDWNKRPVAKSLFFHSALKRGWQSAAVTRYLSAGEASQAVVSAERPFVVPNGMTIPAGDDRVTSRQNLQFREEHGIAATTTVFVFIGRITAQKAVVELVRGFREAARQGHDIALALVGPHDSPYSDRVMAECRDLIEAQRAIVTGPLYGTAKTSALAAADAFATLSQSEGLPLAILEAMAWGKPVLITPDANLPAVGKTNAGVVTSPDPFHVAEAIARLVDPRRRVEMGLNARRLVRDEFEWPRVIPRLEDLYQRAMNLGRRADPSETVH